MPLNTLKPAPGSRHPKRIVGRGEGSGLGQTAGKGQKGQTCRSGDTIMVGFEGGQMPLIRRIPKRGFRHASKIYYQPINLGDLERLFETGAQVDVQALVKAGLLKNTRTPFKILGDGELKKALTVKAAEASQTAEERIKKAGGQLVKG